MENTVFQISAGDLADYCFPQGNLGVMPSVERMFQGTAAHKKLQNAYAEDESIVYKREVPLEYEKAYDGFTIKLQGRADGIIFDKTKWCIHEIKSTYCSFESIETPLKASHKAQMMIYAYIVAKEKQLTEISGRLSYFCLSDDKIVDFEYTFSTDALKSVLDQMLDDYAQIIRHRINSMLRFCESAKALPFPYESFRPGQREGAAQVYSALKQGKNLFLQAPTGAGKTIMTLFPSVKYTFEEPHRIFCLSAKNQTMSVTNDSVDLMRKKGLKVKSCMICAKSKYCLLEKQSCIGEACPYAIDFYKKLHSSLPTILENDDFSFDFIRDLGKKYEICPYELALELSLFSHIIICDYNYLFDPVVYLRRFFDFDGKYIFLIDEAHNLIERGRDMYSAKISRGDLQIKKLFSKETKLFKSFAKVLTQLNKLLKLYDDEAELSLEDVKKLSLEILQANSAVSEASASTLLPSEVTVYIKELMRFLTICEFYTKEDFSLYIKGGSVILQCIDPAKLIEDKIKKSSSTILYSATLEPYEFYKNSILPNTEAFGYSMDFPFDKNNLTVLADYSIDTRYANREMFYEAIAKKISFYRSCAKGNILVYFPSYAFMEAIAELCDVEIMLQPRQADSIRRSSFLDELQNSSDATAFAVMGSHFSEGIDIKNLKGIIIVGVALPQFNISRTKIQDHFEQKYKKGFDYAYTYPGINKVCQASGRLIRNSNDKGFIILLDERFRRYKGILPKHWRIVQITSPSQAEAALKAATSDC